MSTYHATALAEDRSSDTNFLIARAQQGDVEALAEVVNAYQYIVDRAVRGRFLRWGEEGDLKTYANIGLIQAIRAYDGSAPFEHFATRCVNKDVFSAIKFFERGKHRILSFAESLQQPAYDNNDEITLEDTLYLSTVNPEEAVEEREFLDYLTEFIRENCTDLECICIARTMEGKSMKEIMEEIGKNKKSVDNAIQRARRKLRGALRKVDREMEIY